MHKLVKPLCLWVVVLILPFFSAQAESLLFQKSNDFSSKNIELFLQRFTKEPHPMGSLAQKKLAYDLKDTLAHFGLRSTLQKFKSLAPDMNDQNRSFMNGSSKKLRTVLGYNVIASLKGKQKCAVILGGHYDTKYFSNQYFVGANDGGSSTALLLELARVSKQTYFNQNSLGGCSIYFVFFDGEESFLPNWDDGKLQLSIQDNLYGSRFFSSSLLQKKADKIYLDHLEIKLIFILDMVGHKNQTLFITKGSNLGFANKLMEASEGINISQNKLEIEDDQSSFLKYFVPTLHLIDWTNLDEWHTPNDTSKIVCYDKISKLGKSIVTFLKK